MIDLDEILYNALTADTAIQQAVQGRVKSTCFEVAPDEQDNTPMPCIIVMDDGLRNQSSTKDTEWEGMEDNVQASIEVDAESPKAVKRLIKLCRKAVANYIQQMQEDGEDIPYLDNLQVDGLAWDWMKPCYHQTLIYQCIIENS